MIPQNISLLRFYKGEKVNLTTLNSSKKDSKNRKGSGKGISDNKNDVNDEENNDEPILTDEEIENLDINSQKAKKLVKQFEKETSKYAVWRGNVTEAFKKWLKKEKIYFREKERISLYVSEETKNEWQDFINQNKEEFPTFSRLIRQCVKSYIEDSRKGRTSLSKLYRKSIENHEYDILLIEDDLATIRLITSYFNSKGYICRGFASGAKGLEELGRAEPKVILLDIILPDLNGYDVCKTIKSDKEFRNIPIFFLTAISGSEVKKHLKETKVDGYILKPFNLSDFDVILEILKSFKNDDKKITNEEDDNDDNDNDYEFMLPYPVIPPNPPGAVGAAKRKIYRAVMKRESDYELYCQYCGKELTKDEQFSHNCKKKPK